MSFEAGGRTFTGCTVESFAATARGLGADAVGINLSLIHISCGIFHPSFLGKLQDQMCSGFQELLVAVDLSRGEAADILPGIIRQIADRRVETILLVGLFDVEDVYKRQL